MSVPIRFSVEVTGEELLRAMAGVFFALTLVACVAGGPATESKDSAIRMTLLGQALIEHDPRSSLDSPLATVRPHLDSADVVFTNLEVAIKGENCECVPTRDDVFFHGASPEVLDYLKVLGVNLLALSNNHSWDYGTEGVRSTIDEASKRQFVHAGLGSSSDEATAPAYLEVGRQRIALVSMATVNTDPRAAATEDRPGVNVLMPDDSVAWTRNLEAVKEGVRNSDWVVVYHHFQIGDAEAWQRDWAHAVVDAGADIYVSHGQPTLSGVEWYGGGLVFYGLGNFIFHTKTEPNSYPEDVWESVLAEIRLERQGKAIVTFIPVVLSEGTPGPHFLETRGYPEVSDRERGESILRRLARLSSPLGTEVRIEGDLGYIEGAFALRAETN